MIYHTDKTGKTYKGVIELEALCQNILYPKGREQIREKFEKDKLDIPPLLAKALATKGGPVVGIYGKKCKVCPDLEGETLYYRLPKDGVWQHINIDEDNGGVAEIHGVQDAEEGTELDITNFNSEVSGFADAPGIDEAGIEPQMSIEELKPDLPEVPQDELSPEEEKVLEEVRTKGFIKNAVLQKLLSCEDSKASKMLADLCKRGWPERVGRGSGTCNKLHSR